MDEVGVVIKGSVALSEKLVRHLARMVVSEADDVGLVDLGEIVAGVARDALPVTDDLVDALSLTRVGRHLALRDTKRVRAKLALMEIGRPATKEEIEEVADQKGFAITSVGTALSSIDSIARADKSRWGLIEWIDDVYEGISAEIQQRINEHNGAVPLTFLLKDISERFGVNEGSIRSYVATRQFNVADGMVSLASASNYNYRPVEDVATRNKHGELCWDFPVKAQYLKGISIDGFPPELARVLGCGPNDRREVRVASPDGCDPISVIWRLSSVSGAAQIGKVRDALQRAGATAGRYARIVIADEGCAVRFELVENAQPSTELLTADDLLARMKNRRRIS